MGGQGIHGSQEDGFIHSDTILGMVICDVFTSECFCDYNESSLNVGKILAELKGSHTKLLVWTFLRMISQHQFAITFSEKPGDYLSALRFLSDPRASTDDSWHLRTGPDSWSDQNWRQQKVMKESHVNLGYKMLSIIIQEKIEVKRLGEVFSLTWGRWQKGSGPKPIQEMKNPWRSWKSKPMSPQPA